MLLETPWDKGNSHSTAPAWTRERMIDALSPIPITETDIRHVKSPHNGEDYPYYDLTFGCGCTYIGDRGWDACNNALHELLANAGERSTLAVRYFHLRKRFDGVLAEAWRRHPEAVRDEDLRQQGLNAIQYRLGHDILLEPIWRNDSLEADLATIPLECRLNLYNGATTARPHLILELTRDSLDESPQNETALEVLHPLDVSDYTVEQIIALLP